MIRLKESVSMFRLRTLAIGIGLLAAALAFAPAGTLAAAALPSLWTNAVPPGGVVPAKNSHLQKLKHLIFIIQENRSFDHYFGTFPGADGFPSPLPCLPSNWYPSQCFTPYLNHDVRQQGGPYSSPFQEADIDGGLMDGFVKEREKELEEQHCQPPAGVRRHSPQELNYLHSVDDDEGYPNGDTGVKCSTDVMGYHDGTDLPNYWAYAKNFVLLDHFFESVHSQSHPSHLELFSGWTAYCMQVDPPDVNTCHANSDPSGTWGPTRPLSYLWTDITYLLWQHDIPWGVYLDGGQDRLGGRVGVQPIWSVLPGFQTVQDDGQVANSQITFQSGDPKTQFYTDAANGTLPSVSWVLPKFIDSEHPQAHIDYGETYVTGLVNAVMSGPDWNSTAIFISHDDMGGFYDHEVPGATFDTLGLGIRVPAILISPYAKKGHIDHNMCSTDCYIKLIEDVFLGGERMDQAGRPDPRSVYRDELTQYKSLADDFDFSKAPEPPLILPLHPMSLLRDGPPHAPPASSIHYISQMTHPVR
jgi:phospholipase C